MEINNAHDNYTEKQIGENGHDEYGWSTNIKERISQLNFQLTRNDINNLHKLRKMTDEILTELNDLLIYGVIDKEEFTNLMSIMFKLIGHINTIINRN